MPEPTDRSASAPVLQVVSGDPTPEELAALIAVLATKAGAAAATGTESDPDRSAWLDRARYLRTTLPHGHGAWRASAWPH